ncbi:MAG TPA: D-alanyl-D-alanine carboxypeptidase family protein [Blastocatellia bacterium]
MRKTAFVWLGRSLITFSIAILVFYYPASAEAAAKRAKRAGCKDCAAGGKTRKRKAGAARQAPCQPKGYIDPKVAPRYNAAMRQLKRAGIKPKVTSAWRSSEHQNRLHQCSRSRRCRRQNPGLYYAMPSGRSLHEAGFAVDISGVAAGPRGKKRLTPRGRKIVSVMQKNGFRWKYGLADPAHFEADPRKYGYRSVKQAIVKNQTQCSTNISRGKSRSASRLRKASGNSRTNSKKRLAARNISRHSRRGA